MSHNSNHCYQKLLLSAMPSSWLCDVAGILHERPALMECWHWGGDTCDKLVHSTGTALYQLNRTRGRDHVGS